MSSPINPLDPLVVSAAAAAEVRPSTFIVTSAMLTEHNLQGLVELQYIRIGNEVMNSALTRLDGALSLTQKALDSLSGLQFLHNQIKVTANSSFPLNFTSTNQVVTLTSKNSLSQTVTYLFTVDSREKFVSAYNKLASVYYGQPLKPFFHVSLGKQTVATAFTPAHPAYSVDIVTGNEPAYQIFLAMLASARNDLSALILQLAAPGMTNPTDPNTLLAKLRPVLDDFPDLTNFSAVRGWAIDNYGAATGAGVTQAGQFQQRITNAITAAESTNTKQQEAVRRYMFIFEQYCQSAAAILKALDQLFEKMARNIG